MLILFFFNQRNFARSAPIQRFLTCAAAHVLSHDASEVPEARLAAVTLLPPDTGLTGALASGGITRALVGAVEVTLTGT